MQQHGVTYRRYKSVSVSFETFVCQKRNRYIINSVRFIRSDRSEPGYMFLHQSDPDQSDNLRIKTSRVAMNAQSDYLPSTRYDSPNNEIY